VVPDHSHTGRPLQDQVQLQCRVRADHAAQVPGDSQDQGEEPAAAPDLRRPESGQPDSGAALRRRRESGAFVRGRGLGDRGGQVADGRAAAGARAGRGGAGEEAGAGEVGQLAGAGSARYDGRGAADSARGRAEEGGAEAVVCGGDAAGRVDV